MFDSFPSSSRFATERDEVAKVERTHIHTAYIHLHSLVSRDISLPCPQRFINHLQQLLIEVVIFYERMEGLPNVISRSQEQVDHLDVCSQSLDQHLHQITCGMGERLMEAVLWAWLHALLQSEGLWRLLLNQERGQLHFASQYGDEATATALMSKLKYRVEDICALRRVTVFVFEALRCITAVAPPLYSQSATDDASNAVAPPAYCHCAAHQGEQEREASLDADLAVASPLWQRDPDDDDGCSVDSISLTFLLCQAEAELEQWKPIGKSLRRQISDLSLCSTSSEQLIKPGKRLTVEGIQPDLQADFQSWLQQPPLRTLRIEHRLERRHWSFEQIANPVLLS